MRIRLFIFTLFLFFRASAHTTSGPFFPADTIRACGRTYTLTATSGLSGYQWSTGATTPTITVSRSGWYSLAAVQNGTVLRDSVFLNLLYVNIINNDTSICPGTGVILNAETAFNYSCTGLPAQQYSNWTSIGPLGVIYKWNNTYYIRTLTDVLQSSNLNGPWVSMNFNTQISVIGPAELLGVDATGRLHVGTTNNGQYVYNNGVWTSTGMGGAGTAGQFFTLLSNGRIIISKSGSLAGIHYSDDNGNTWTQSNAPASTWFSITVANNGTIFAVGSQGVIRSDDNGTTWTSINAQLGGITTATGISKDCNGTLWMVADRMFYRSTDNGNTWVPVLQIPGLFTSNPTAGTLLATSNGEVYYYGFISPFVQGLFVTRDGGLSWTPVTGFPGLLSYLKEIDGQLITMTNLGIYALTLQPLITLQWSTGATTPSITVSPGQTTTYYVTATNGVTTCTDSVRISVGAVFSNLFSQDTIYHCGSSVDVSAPAGYTSYQWNTGANSRTISVTDPGLYFVQAQPSTGCPVFDSVFVNILDISILNNDTTICPGDSLDLTVDPGTGLRTSCFNPEVVKGGNSALGYNSVAVDDAGNYFLSGAFSGNVTIAGFPLTTSGGQDIFLAKYDSCGNPLWAIKGGSTSSGDDAGSIDADAAGNIYFTGRYNQPLTLTGTGGTSYTAAYTPTGNGGHQDGFVVKISPSGQILWGATIQGGSNDGFSHVTVDNNDCPIVTGGFNGCCPSTFAATITGPNGSVNVNSFGANYGTGVMVKFDPAGNILWRATIHNRDVGMDRTAVDAANNIYVVGAFRSWNFGTPAQFIDGAGSNNTIFNPGIGLSYLVKLNANGIWQWGVSMGNQGDGVGSLTGATDVKTDAAGNPWVVGYYSGAACTFYTTAGATLNQPPSVSNRGFLVQYSTAGVPLLSASHQQSTGFTVFTGLSIAGSNIGVTGYYNGSNQGGSDALLMMYDFSGQVVQTATPGGTADDYLNSIDWNGSNFVIGGATASPLLTIDSLNLNGSCNFLWNASAFGMSSNTIQWSTGATTPSIRVAPSQTTTYYVTVSNGFHSCVDSVKVTVNNSNIQLFSQDTISICGSSYSLSAAPGYPSYSWNTGATTQSINVTSTGWYSCTVLTGGCPSTDSVFISLVNADIINNDTIICNGDSVTLSILSNVQPRPCGQLPSDLQTGLVAYYPFCGNANDAIGSNNGIVYNATLSPDRNSRPGTSFLFNGANSSIIPAVTNKTMVNTFTYAFWARPLITAVVPNESQSGNAASGLFSNPCVIHPIHGVTFGNTTLNAGSGIYVGTNGLYIEEHSDGWEAVPLSYSANLSGWHYYIVVYDNKVPSLYIDGNFIKSGIPSSRNIYASLGKDEYPAYTRSGFGAGYSPPSSSTSQYFTGDIDEVVYYNKALSLNDIRGLYSSGSSLLWSTGDTSSTIRVNPAQTTTYYVTVSNGITSCTDSVKVFVNQPTTSLSTLSACDSLSWNGSTYTQSGTYSAIGFTNTSGCDSIANLDLTINASTHNLLTQAACDTFRWNGNLYNQSGTYLYNYTNTVGCPSTDTLQLTITPTNTVVNINDTSFCAGGTVTINAQTSPPGNYYYTWTVPAGATNPGNQASITTGTPGLYSVFVTPVSNLLCNSDFEDNLLVAPGAFTLTNQANVPCWQTTASDQQIEIWGSGTNGVPSYSGIQFIELNANMFSTLFQNFSGVAGTPVTVSFAHRGRAGVDVMGVEIGPLGGPYTSLGNFADGNTAWGYYTVNFTLPFSASGNYSLRFVSVSTAAGNISVGNFLDAISVSMTTCPGPPDSCVVSVSQPTSSVTTLSACDSLRWNGTLYTASGNYSFLTVNSKGCDSTANLALTIFNSSFNVLTQTVCDSLRWNGILYTQSGTYIYNYFNANGCASADTLRLTVNRGTFNSTIQTICDSLRWNGILYTQSGTYIYNYFNANGCPSADTLRLIVNRGTFNSGTQTTCDSLRWNGTLYTQSGTYIYNYNNTNGCPSADTLQLTVNRGTFNSNTQTVCDSLRWNGTLFTQSGTYVYNYNNSNGCPSADTLRLIVDNTQPVNTTASACNSYIWNGSNYTQSGTYLFSYNSGICNITDTLFLTINTGTFTAQAQSACLSFTWNGNTYIASGTYIYNYINSSGCASADTLRLNISNGIPASTTVAACGSYTWNGTTYTAGGTYLYSYSAGTCNVTDTLFLTTNNGTFNTQSQSACGSYTWNGSTYTLSGTYVYNYNNANGCPSADTLRLTVDNTQPATTTASACNNYTWNGNNYTTSGTYLFSYSSGICNITDTLFLTINSGTFTTQIQSACLSFTWNGTTYTNSGTYIYNYNNSNGCASADTLLLNISNGIPAAVTVTACGSYVWNGTSYTTGGTYLYSYSAGTCNVTDTLYLTINNGTFTTQNQTACKTYTWNNNTYLNSGTYLFEYVNSNGCPSADTLRLTIFPGPSLGPDRSLRICFGNTSNLAGLFNTQSLNSTWTYNQNVIAPPISVSQAGNYFLTATDNNGCSDSAIATLIVQPQLVANAGPDRYEETNVPFILNGSGGINCFWSPANVLNSFDICNPQATIASNTQFVLTVYDNYGCTDTDTVLIKLLNGPEIYVPNAFTPNGDGLNDGFGPVTVGITELEYFRIYNRYGELVFETSDPARKWNGYYKGKLQGTGGFVWMASFKDRTGKLRVKKGNVALIR